CTLDLDPLDPLYATSGPRTLRTRCTLDFRVLPSPCTCSATRRLPRAEVKLKSTTNLDPTPTHPRPRACTLHLAPWARPPSHYVAFTIKPTRQGSTESCQSSKFPSRPWSHSLTGATQV